MRLFLSSQDLGNYSEVLVDLVGQNKKAYFINNAKDDMTKAEKQASTADKKRMFQDFGFEFKELDLRDYFGKTNLLKKDLKDAGLIWSSGGNTFILRRAMAASGLDKFLVNALAEDKFVYGGSSAGSCVAAKTLEGIDKGDRAQPDAVPDNYPSKEIIWEGLGLVPFMIVPHCGSDWFDHKAKATIEYLKEHKLPYKALQDGQVVVVNGGKTELLK